MIQNNETRSLYVDRDGNPRNCIDCRICDRRNSNIWLVYDHTNDELAIKFIVKNLEKVMFMNNDIHVINNYKAGKLALVVCFTSRDENDTTVNVEKVGRYKVVVYRNATADTVQGIIDGKIKIQCLEPDPHVVALADRLVPDVNLTCDIRTKNENPGQQMQTCLDIFTMRAMKRSLEKTSVRKRGNWSFVINDKVYGRSTVKFENGKFIDYTKNGPQQINMDEFEKIVNAPHVETDVLSARAKSYVN